MVYDLRQAKYEASRKAWREANPTLDLKKMEKAYVDKIASIAQLAVAIYTFKAMDISALEATEDATVWMWPKL